MGFSMKIYKKIIIVLFLLTIFIVISAMSYVIAVSNNISNSVFRLHVIANSDSYEDQNLKYKVRDSLINYMNSLTQNITSKDAAITIAKEHTQDFYDIAHSVIEDNGFNYDVNIEIGNSYFPTKYYGDISLPAGYYDALKVEIGNSAGQNWWCVMFPPLCFVDVSTGIVPDDSKNTIKEQLPSEEYALISEAPNNKALKFKFKLIELFERNQSR